jgi:hypothetical protein
MREPVRLQATSSSVDHRAVAVRSAAGVHRKRNRGAAPPVVELWDKRDGCHDRCATSCFVSGADFC